MSKYIVTPVQADNWHDLEQFFESRGGPHSCWCMVWRPMPSKDRSDKVAKKAALKQRISENVPIGILAYDGAVPVGWCSVAPISSLRALHATTEPTPCGSIWAIVCFFVPRSHRGQGVTTALIEGAISYAKTQGASHVEAYPVDSDSPSYRFMGIREPFDDAGFEYVGVAGSRRHRMRRPV